MFTIGSGNVSVTKIPEFYPLGDSDGLEDTYVVDCPGINDTNEYNNFPNYCVMRSLIANASKIVLCFVTSGGDLDSARGSLFYQQATAVKRLLSQVGVMNASKLMMTVINKPPAARSFKGIEAKIAETLEFTNKKMDKINLIEHHSDPVQLFAKHDENDIMN